MQKVLSASLCFLVICFAWPVQARVGDAQPMVGANGAAALGESGSRVAESGMGVGAVVASGNIPMNVHLSVTHSNKEVRVMFMAPEGSGLDKGYVRYGGASGAYPNVVQAATHTYVAGNYTSPALFTATFSNLTASTTYFYQVTVDGATWSTEYHFKAPPRVGTLPITVAAVADLGQNCYEPGCGNDTIADMNAAALDGAYDFVIHAGDIAYTGGDQTVWDAFLEQVQPAASHTPYMTCPGNHEHWFNFTGYLNRFSMPGVIPGTVSNLWNSYDYGGIHFVAMSTEHDFYEGSPQHAFLVEDLAKANANRDVVPWIVFYGHRPFYCSTDDYYDCRIFAPYKLRPNLEKVLHESKVDLALAGHLHAYERSYPVYNGTVMSTNYKNPNATTYVVVGMAGDDEGLTDRWYNPKPDFSAYRDAQLGWTRFTAHNASVLSFEYVLSGTGHVQDSFTIVKTSETESK